MTADDDDDGPIPLDYHPSRDRRRWLPADPLALPRVAGVAVGFAIPMGLRVWAEAADRVTRVPPLWYQHRGWPIVCCGAIGVVLAFTLRTRFFSAVAVGLFLGTTCCGLSG